MGDDSEHIWSGREAIGMGSWEEALREECQTENLRRRKIEVGHPLSWASHPGGQARLSPGIVTLFPGDCHLLQTEIRTNKNASGLWEDNG